MPIIHHNEHTAKTFYRCASDGCHIRPGDRYHRLYGMAHEGDTPYAMRVCPLCFERYGVARQLRKSTPKEEK